MCDTIQNDTMGESIFGYTPDSFFDHQFSQGAEEKSNLSQTKMENDIFQRLKRRIKMAQQKPEEPETITIDDSDDDDTPVPVWKPGQYLMKFRQQEIGRKKVTVLKGPLAANVNFLKKRILSVVKTAPKTGKINFQFMKLPNGKIIKIRLQA